MKRKSITWMSISLVFVFFLAQFMSIAGGVYAQNTGDTGNKRQVFEETGTSPDNTSFLNPLAFDSIEGFLGALLDVLVIFAVPVIIFFIIYAGFTYVTAQGSEEKVSKAHRMLLYALVGGLLILGAKGLIAVIESTAKPFLR